MGFNENETKSFLLRGKKTQKRLRIIITTNQKRLRLECCCSKKKLIKNNRISIQFLKKIINNTLKYYKVTRFNLFDLLI